MLPKSHENDVFSLGFYIFVKTVFLLLNLWPADHPCLRNHTGHFNFSHLTCLLAHGLSHILMAIFSVKSGEVTQLLCTKWALHQPAQMWMKVWRAALFYVPMHTQSPSVLWHQTQQTSSSTPSWLSQPIHCFSRQVYRALFFFWIG